MQSAIGKVLVRVAVLFVLVLVLCKVAMLILPSLCGIYHKADVINDISFAASITAICMLAVTFNIPEKQQIKVWQFVLICLLTAVIMFCGVHFFI